MSTCKKCGNQMPDNVKFCGVCGTPFEAVNVTGATPSVEADKVVTETTDKAETVGASGTVETPTKGATQQFGNGTQQFGNGTQQFGNGTQQFGNGAQQFGNGAQQFGNGAQQFGNGAAQQFGNGAQQFGNGAAQQFQSKESTADYYSKLPYTAPAEDAVANKGVAICAYFGLLWLVPLLTTAKHSPFAKFHTNQAIIITIVSAALNLVAKLFGWILEHMWWRFYWVSLGFSIVVMLFALALMIWGIVYAAQGKMKEIPVIGQFKILK